MDRGWMRWLLGLPPTLGSVLRALRHPLIDGLAYAVQRHAEAPGEILDYDRLQVLRWMNVGVLAMGSGENTEKSLYAHVPTSLSYSKFVGNLKAIRLEHMDINWYIGSQIECSREDKEFIERKRLVGNCHLVVLYNERHGTMNLQTVASRQNHVFLIVTLLSALRFRVSVYKRPDLRAFPVPEAVDLGTEEGRRLFLSLLLYAQWAVLKSPVFTKLLSKKRNEELWEVINALLL